MLRTCDLPNLEVNIELFGTFARAELESNPVGISRYSKTALKANKGRDIIWSSISPLGVIGNQPVAIESA